MAELRPKVTLKPPASFSVSADVEHLSDSRVALRFRDSTGHALVSTIFSAAEATALSDALAPVAPPPPDPEPPPPPDPPFTALITVNPEKPVTGSPTTFGLDISGGSTPFTYLWLVDDLTGTGPTFSYSFVNPNTKVVNCTVTDQNGKTAKAPERRVAIGSPTPPPLPPPPPPVPDPVPDPVPPPSGQVVLKTRAPRRPALRLIGENVEDIHTGVGVKVWARIVPSYDGEVWVAPLHKWDGVGLNGATPRCIGYKGGCYGYGDARKAKLIEAAYSCNPNTGLPASLLTTGGRSLQAAIDDWHARWGGSPTLGFLPSAFTLPVKAGVPFWYSVMGDPSNANQHGTSIDFVRSSQDALGPNGKNSWPGDAIGRQGMLECEVAATGMDPAKLNFADSRSGGGDAWGALITAVLVYKDGRIEPAQPLYAYHATGNTQQWKVPSDRTKLVALGAKAKGSAGGKVLAYRGGSLVADVSHDGDYDEKPVSPVAVTPGETITVTASMACVKSADDGSLQGAILPDGKYADIFSSVAVWAVFA